MPTVGEIQLHQGLHGQQVDINDDQDEMEEQKNVQMINLYVQLPGEMMSELVRDYMAKLYCENKYFEGKGP